MKLKMIRPFLFFLLIGISSHLWAQDQAKIDSLQQVLKTKLTPKKKVDVYNLLAEQYISSDSSKLIDYTSKAIALAEEINYMEGKVDALQHQAVGMSAKKHFEQGETLFKQSLQIAKKNKYLQGMARAYRNIAIVQRIQGNYLRVMEYSKLALKINQQIRDSIGIAASFVSLGAAYERQGDYSQTHKFYQLAIDAYKQIRDPKQVANIYNKIGLIYGGQGNYSNALEAYRHSLKIGQQLKNKGLISIAKTNIGNIYNQQGKYAKALNVYHHSLKIHKQIGRRIQIIGSYINIGHIYKNQGRYDQALITFQQAIKIAKQIDRSGKYMEAICYIHIGDIYQLQGNYTQALQAYKESLKITQQMNNKNLMASNHNYMGVVYQQQGKYINALKSYKTALKISKQNRDKESIVQSYLNLGKLALAQKQLTHAQDHFKQALTLRSEMGEKQLSAEANVNLGIAYYTEKQYTTAQSYLEKGMKMGQEIGDPHIVRDGAEYLSKVYEALDKPQKALEAHVLFKQMADSLLNSRNIRQLTRLETQFVATKRQDSLQLVQDRKETEYQADIQQRKFSQRMTLLGLGLSAALLVVLAFFYRSKQRSNRKLGELNKNLESSYQEIKTVNAQLQELTDFKSRMTDLIIHDLKNPLASIIGLTSGKTESALDKTSIATIAQQMLYMTQNILDVQKNEDATLHLQLQPLAIVPIIQQVINQQQILASAKNIQLQADAISNDQVQADEDILVRILTNLLSNAIKFTPENGAIKISSNSVANEPMLRLEVQDTGKGIPANQLDKIFDKFHSIDKKQKGNFRSTGLGLTFCKLAVEQLGGTIGVKSEEGRGSTFWFTLPLVAKSGESSNYIISMKPGNNLILEEVAKIKAQLQSNDQALLKAIIAEIHKQKLDYTQPTRLARIFDTVKAKVEVSQAVESWMQMLLKEATSQAIFEALVTIDT